MALSNTFNFEVKQGDDFTIQFTVKNANYTPFVLTGYTARLQVRKTYGAAAALIDATTANLKLNIPTPTDGIIFWEVAAAETSAIIIPGDDETIDLVYDLEIISSTTKVLTPARGTMTLYREVTR